MRRRIFTLFNVIGAYSAGSMGFDGLFVIVLFENKIFLLEPAHGSAVRVGHSHEHVDQVDVNLQCRCRLGLPF